MRQLRWLQLVKNYDCEILYHPKKMNSVTNNLSRKEGVKLMSNQTMNPKLQREISEMELKLIVGRLANLTIQPTIFQRMKGAQLLDPELVKIRDDIQEGKESIFSFSKDEILHLNG